MGSKILRRWGSKKSNPSKVSVEIQDCCTANRIPPPRLPLSNTDVSAFLSDLSLCTKSGNLPQCLLLATKMRSLVKESENNKRCFVSNGASRTLTAAFLRFPAEEILAALTATFPLDNGSLTLLSVPESLLSLVKMVDSGGPAARLYAVLVLKELVRSDVSVAGAATRVNGMAEAMINLLRDSFSVHASKASLVAIFCMASSNEEIAAKYADMGVVPLLLDALVACDKSTAEKITAVLDVICDSRRGRRAAQEHALSVPLLVKKILRVSVITTEFSVSVLLKLCKSSTEEEVDSTGKAGESVAAALQVGAFQKLLLLLQLGCGEATKEKASAMLKLLNRSKSTDCFESLDVKPVKRPF